MTCLCIIPVFLHSDMQLLNVWQGDKNRRIQLTSANLRYNSKSIFVEKIFSDELK